MPIPWRSNCDAVLAGAADDDAGAAVAVAVARDRRLWPRTRSDSDCRCRNIPGCRSIPRPF